MVTRGYRARVANSHTCMHIYYTIASSPCPGRTDVQDMQDLCKNLAQILHAKLARFADSTARACKILAEILLRARKMSVFLHVSCKFLQESCNPLLQDLASNFQTCKKPCTVDFLQENVQDLCKILIQERMTYLQDYGHFSCKIMDTFLA